MYKRLTLRAPIPKFNLGDKVRDTLNKTPNEYIIAFRLFSPDLCGWFYQDNEGAGFCYKENELELVKKAERNVR